MKATELQKALESSITSCQPSAYWKNHMVRRIVKGEEMAKRTKLSTGVICKFRTIGAPIPKLAVRSFRSDRFTHSR